MTTYKLSFIPEAHEAQSAHEAGKMPRLELGVYRLGQALGHATDKETVKLVQTVYRDTIDCFELTREKQEQLMAYFLEGKDDAMARDSFLHALALDRIRYKVQSRLYATLNNARQSSAEQSNAEQQSSSHKGN